MFAAHSVTISLLRGSLQSQAMLHAVAHFDVTITQDSRMPVEDCRKYFDMRLFKQVDDVPLVILPSKKRTNTYHVIEQDEVKVTPSKKKSSKSRLDISDFVFDDCVIMLPLK